MAELAAKLDEFKPTMLYIRGSPGAPPDNIKGHLAPIYIANGPGELRKAAAAAPRHPRGARADYGSHTGAAARRIWQLPCSCPAGVYCQLGLLSAPARGRRVTSGLPLTARTCPLIITHPVLPHASCMHGMASIMYTQPQPHRQAG
jgi:hypothetical protein